MTKSRSLQIPADLNEHEVLDTIERVTKLVSQRFVFGYYDIEDVMQEARIMGLECLSKYDRSRPLENFVYTHVVLHLINMLRDKCRRNDAPCKRCHNGDPCGEDGHFCEKYKVWYKRNATKANLAKPVRIDAVAEKAAEPPDFATKEVLELLDKHIPLELRSCYLQMRAGVSLPKAKREAVLAAARTILSISEHGDEETEA